MALAILKENGSRADFQVSRTDPSPTQSDGGTRPPGPASLPKEGTASGGRCYCSIARRRRNPLGWEPTKTVKVLVVPVPELVTAAQLIRLVEDSAP